MNTEDLGKLIGDLSKLIYQNQSLPERENRIDDLLTLVASRADLINAREYAKITSHLS